MRATSSREDWQREAHRLELQGKQEQAEAVRTTILKEIPVSWPVFDEARLRELLVKVFRERLPAISRGNSSSNMRPRTTNPCSPCGCVEEAEYAASAGFRPAARDPRPAPS